MSIERHGLRVKPARGWEARIYRRPLEDDETVTRPVLHACTRAMPVDRGDFGRGVVEELGPEDVFVSLVEFGPESAGTGLFARPRPRLRPSDFAVGRMPRSIPGQSAAQLFFTEAGRAFCLYVVIGSHARRMALAPRAAQLVATLSIDSSTTAGGRP